MILLREVVLSNAEIVYPDETPSCIGTYVQKYIMNVSWNPDTDQATLDVFGRSLVSAKIAYSGKHGRAICCKIVE
jgi:hypothetical protein